MKIIMIEATADELSANRTVMDNVNNVLTRFADVMFGINKIDISNVAYKNKECKLEND